VIINILNLEVFMNTDTHIILPDGRKLTYAEFGQPDGCPVMYFHGAPSSCLEPLLLGDEVWKRFGLRIIAPNRPGMGQSDFQPNRSFSNWTKDVISLADALGLGQFSVLGFSGDGGYVAACAAKIPERLSAAVIVSGGWQMNLPEAKENLPFPNRLLFIFAEKAPFLMRLMLKVMRSSSSGTREKELAELKKRVPLADYQALEQPGRLDALSRIIVESMPKDTKGAAWDLRLYVRDIGFRLDEIQMPLYLFHGEQDVNAPIALVRKMTAQIPNAKLIVYENEAHFSTLCNRLDEFLPVLVRAN